MTEHTYSKMEIVGSSTVSSDEAIRNAIEKASDISNMHWFEVVETRGYIEQNQVSYFQVTLKIGYRNP